MEIVKKYKIEIFKVTMTYYNAAQLYLHKSIALLTVFV